jgi:hypothetical protein
MRRILGQHCFRPQTFPKCNYSGDFNGSKIATDLRRLLNLLGGIVARRNDARREVIGRLIGDLGEIQARLLHLVLDEPKPAMASSALASAVDGLESVLEHLRRAVADRG